MNGQVYFRKRLLSSFHAKDAKTYKEGFSRSRPFVVSVLGDLGATMSGSNGQPADGEIGGVYPIFSIEEDIMARILVVDE